jgi:NADPH-dependent curcumin reductase CurA
MNRQFLIAARPRGMVQASDFKYQESSIPEIGAGEILIKTDYLSIDPSLRGQMENRTNYAAPLEIGDVMNAGGCGTVVASRNPKFPEGCKVQGSLGMQDYTVSDGRSNPVRQFDESLDPEAVLSIFGGTGLTAYFGLLDIGKPEPGNTVVVSGAAGATGSVAGQIAHIKGCRVIGLAGTNEKCVWLGELGFDAAINYKTDDVKARLDELCPDGIDIYFDNVGGDILDYCLARLAMNARVVLCGGISQYNKQGPMVGPKNYFNLIGQRARMEGFLVMDYARLFNAAIAEMQQWVNAGQLSNRVHVVEGFENLPSAMIGMFQGENTGKTLVKV